MNNTPVSARVLDAAIAWQLCLGASQGSALERAEFEKWHAADSEHARAWLQLGMLDQRFAAAAGPARQVLTQSREGLRRQVRKLGGGLASIVLLGAAVLFANQRYHTLDYWLADQRTGTGEQRTLRLADGTLIDLNTHSAVDIRYSAERRLIVLREGEILIQTGHKHDDQRPFEVQTPDGKLRALGTRFMVRRESAGTRLGVLQSAVAARSEGSQQDIVLREGQQVLMHRQGLEPIHALAPGADAWSRGMLVVDNARLGDVIGELGRYRSGHLGVSPAVADLRITGSFPLTDTDLALKALLPTLPVQIEQRTRWWVTVSEKAVD